MIRPRIYPLLEETIEVGIKRGWRLAHKHVEDPTEEAIQDRIQEAVMAQILERFIIDDDSMAD